MNHPLEKKCCDHPEHCHDSRGVSSECTHPKPVEEWEKSFDEFFEKCKLSAKVQLMLKGFTHSQMQQAETRGHRKAHGKADKTIEVLRHEAEARGRKKAVDAIESWVVREEMSVPQEFWNALKRIESSKTF